MKLNHYKLHKLLNERKVNKSKTVAISLKQESQIYINKVFSMINSPLTMFHRHTTKGESQMIVTRSRNIKKKL